MNENSKQENGKSGPLSVIFCIVALSFCALYLGLLGYSLHESITTKANSVTLISSAEEYQGVHYQLAASDLRGAGFTNIEIIPLEDLTPEQAELDGSIERISIKGNSKFLEGESFAKEDLVIITYHTLAPEK